MRAREHTNIAINGSGWERDSAILRKDSNTYQGQRKE